MDVDYVSQARISVLSAIDSISMLKRKIADGEDISEQTVLQAELRVLTENARELEEMLPRQRVVVAGTYAEYVQWCAQRGLNPKTDVIYISAPIAAQRLKHGRVEFTGTWFARPDIVPIMEALRV